VDVVNGQGVFRDEMGALISLQGLNFIWLNETVNTQEKLITGYQVLFNLGSYSLSDTESNFNYMSFSGYNTSASS